MSHSNSLKDKKKKSNKVTPERAVVTIYYHKDNSNKGEDVDDEGIYKVSDKESRSSLASTNNTHNREQKTYNTKNKRTKSKKSKHSKNNLYKGQEVNKSG